MDAVAADVACPLQDVLEVAVLPRRTDMGEGGQLLTQKMSDSSYAQALEIFERRCVERRSKHDVATFLNIFAHSIHVDVGLLGILGSIQ